MNDFSEKLNDDTEIGSTDLITRWLRSEMARENQKKMDGCRECCPHQIRFRILGECLQMLQEFQRRGAGGKLQKHNAETTLPSLDAPTCSLLDGLSERAKQWLDKACEQAADSQGITLDLEARNECELAGLIEVDRRQWVTIYANVMDAVYSNGYLKENDPGHRSETTEL